MVLQPLIERNHFLESCIVLSHVVFFFLGSLISSTLGCPAFRFCFGFAPFCFFSFFFSVILTLNPAFSSACSTSFCDACFLISICCCKNSMCALLHFFARILFVNI